MFFVYRDWKQCIFEKNILEEQLNSYCHTVYVAAEKLPKGTILSEELLNLERRYFNLENINLISEEAFGKTVKYDIGEGTLITTEMVNTGSVNGRDVFLSDIRFDAYIQTGDRIDVRIRYDNAEDYTVLADKTVKNYDKSYGIILELTEEEILFFSSALADQKQYEGTCLYIAKYPGNSNLETGKVNYVPNRDILALTGREKAKGESRDALEKRLLRKQ